MSSYILDSLCIAEVIVNKRIPRCVLISVRYFGFSTPEPVPAKFVFDDYEVMDSLADAYEQAANIIDPEGKQGYAQNVTVIVEPNACTIGLCIDTVPQQTILGSLWMDELGMFAFGHGAHARSVAATLRMMSEYAYQIVQEERIYPHTA